ncbi:MAG TPA: hypothetical protein VN824_20245, partial [Puia sp.]|nr:hypothetical protein [Puia sp.]
MKKLLILAFVGAIMAFSTGCYPEFPPEGNGGGHEKPVIETITLEVPYGGQIGFKDISIALLSVPDDSRCPEDVECIWEGNARVVLSLRKLPDGRATEV